MQINLLDPRIKTFVKSYLGWILFFLMVWFNGCSGNDKTGTKTKVIVPAVSGKLETKRPEQTPLKWPEKDQKKAVIKWNEKLIPVENPINIDLSNQYVMAKDSIERLNLYIKAIQLNKFSTKFEDNYLLLNINGIVQGEIQEITPSYTIKERESEAVVKQTYLRVLAGGAVGINKYLNQGVYKLDVDFQNQKGDILSAEYLRVNNQDYGMIGFKKSIFNLKR